MKKSLIITAALIGVFSASISASALESPLSSQSEITVKAFAGNIKNPSVFALANGSSLVSWQEELDGGYFLKTRTISPTNKLGAIQSINSEKAISIGEGSGTKQTVAINKAGKLFAVWVTQGLRYGVQSQKIWGRTSIDGTNWSTPFVVLPGLTVSGDDQDCEMDAMDQPGCGYLRLQAAIDDKNRLAVLVADNREGIGNRYRMKATNFLGHWSNLKTLTSTPSMRSSEIVGLTSGFAVSATRYDSAASNMVKASYYDPKTETWTYTLTGTSIPANTVIKSKWVQRSLKKLSLVMASSNEQGGISLRNFDTESKTWSSELIQIKEREANTVFQDVTAAKVGSELVVMFSSYNQNDGSSQVRVAKNVEGTPTITVIGTAFDQMDLLYIGSSLSNTAVVAFNVSMNGAKLGGTTAETLPITIPNTASNGYLNAMTKSKTDLVQAVGLKFSEGVTSVIFIKGFVN